MISDYNKPLLMYLKKKKKLINNLYMFSNKFLYFLIGQIIFGIGSR